MESTRQATVSSAPMQLLLVGENDDFSYLRALPFSLTALARKIREVLDAEKSVLTKAAAVSYAPNVDSSGILLCDLCRILCELCGQRFWPQSSPCSPIKSALSYNYPPESRMSLLVALIPARRKPTS
jgi:hypothetical protein